MSRKLISLVCLGVTWSVLASPSVAATGDSFSYVVIADPHVSSGSATSSAAHRLQQAVEWVDDHRQSENIDLSFVVGDIGWNEGLPVAKSILDGLTVPYAPLIGDDDVHGSDGNGDLEFYNTFAPVYQSLEALAQDPC